ncbi:MAG TPA: DUF4440 domain-containing protein [Gemmatimonadaceae bacterium]|nr:DUF4440 domain-containing protein [Gemmatimonadaceae bacterium]
MRPVVLLAVPLLAAPLAARTVEIAPATASVPSPRSAVAAQAPARVALLDSLRAVDAGRGRVAARLGAPRATAALLADDAIYLRAGWPVVRGAAVRALLAGEDSTLRAVWQPVRVDVSADGRWGYSQGFRTMLAAGALTTDSYVAVWRRSDDGPWRLAAYAEMGAPPSAAPLPAELDGAVVAAPPAAADAAVEQVLGADRAFAALSAASDPGSAFGRYAAPDAMVFGAGGVLVLGPAAVQAGFGPPSPDHTLAWFPVAGGIAGSGDLGFTVGLAVARFRRPDGSVVERPSKYITVWRRQADGRWAFVTDGGNERPRG